MRSGKNREHMSFPRCSGPFPSKASRTHHSCFVFPTDGGTFASPGLSCCSRTDLLLLFHTFPRRLHLWQGRMHPSLFPLFVAHLQLLLGCVLGSPRVHGAFALSNPSVNPPSNPEETRRSIPHALNSRLTSTPPLRPYRETT